MAVTGVSSPKKIAQTLGECLIVGASGAEFSSGTSCELAGAQQGQAHGVEGVLAGKYTKVQGPCVQSSIRGMDTAVKLWRETLHTGLPGEEVPLLSQPILLPGSEERREAGPRDAGSAGGQGQASRQASPAPRQLLGLQASAPAAARLPWQENHLSSFPEQIVPRKEQDLRRKSHHPVGESQFLCTIFSGLPSEPIICHSLNKQAPYHITNIYLTLFSCTFTSREREGG